MQVAGNWDLVIATPLGKQAVTLELREAADGISGVARSSAEVTPLLDPVLDGNRLSWRQAITRPIRLNLTFEVTIEGDRLTGVSRAGRLPSSNVTGRRVATPE